MTEYENMSRKELMELRTSIDRAIAAVGDRDRRNALKAAEAAAREHGFTLDELMSLMGSPRGRRRNAAEAVERSPGPAGEPRFRNPDNPDQTWSGRGRRPRWVHEAEAAGRRLEDMRIS